MSMFGTDITEPATEPTATEAPAPAAPAPAALETYAVTLTLSVRVTIDPGADHLARFVNGGMRPSAMAVQAEAQRVMSAGMGALGRDYPTTAREITYASVSVSREDDI